jgi:hypothetical protein
LTGDKPLNVSDLQNLHSALAETNLSSQSRKAAAALTNALNRAVEQRLIAKSPAQPLKRRLPRVERLEMRFLDQEQSRRWHAQARFIRPY